MASDDRLVDALEEHESLFEEIADDDDLPQWFREKYGVRPLNRLDRLRRQMDAGEAGSSRAEG